MLPEADRWQREVAVGNRPVVTLLILPIDVALYLNRRLLPFTALNSVLTQLWCNIMGH